MRRLFLNCTLVLGLAFTTQAHAQGDKAASPPSKVDSEAKKEGDYGGVTPGQSEMRPKRRRGRYPVLTWVGFQPKEDGGTRVFFQLDRELEPEQALAGKNLTMTFSGARYGSKNARRRLDTRFFETSALREVVSKRLRRKRSRRMRQDAGLRFTVSFRGESDVQEARISGRTEADGYYYVYADFAPSTERPEEELLREKAASKRASASTAGSDDVAE